jgi:hypothetical protein
MITTYTVYYKEKGSIYTKTMNVKAHTVDEAKKITESRGKQFINAKIIY